MLIGVVGDLQADNPTHQSLNAALAQVGVESEWIATDAVPSEAVLTRRYAGLWLAPASPYRSMEGALAVTRLARERGVPLVGT